MVTCEEERETELEKVRKIGLPVENDSLTCGKGKERRDDIKLTEGERERKR